MAIKTEYSVEEIFVDHISSKTIDVLVSDINPTYAALPFVVTSMGLYTEGPNFRGWNEGYLNYSLHFTLSGSGLVKCSGKEYVIKPGGVFFKNNRERKFFCTHGDHWKFCYINCIGTSTMIFDKLLNANDQLHIIQTNDINDLFRSFVELNILIKRKDIMSVIESSNIINQMLTNLLSISLSQQPDTKLLRCPDWILEARKYIDENYAEKVNVREIARMYHVSEEYFIRSFKKYFGKTPKTYIIIKRLDEGKNLLLTSNDSINEIAYKVGFPSHSLFTQFFKKMYGCTPSDFRNNT